MLYWQFDWLWSTWVADFNETTLKSRSEATPNLSAPKGRRPAKARDKFAFPLNLAFPFLICCLYSLVFRATAFFYRSVLDIWQNMHRDWTDKWFCAKAIFIHSFTFFRFSNANSILRNFQFCSPLSQRNRIGKAGRFNKFRERGCFASLDEYSHISPPIPTKRPPFTYFSRIHDSELNQYSEMIFSAGTFSRWSGRGSLFTFIAGMERQLCRFKIRQGIWTLAWSVC